MIEELKILKKAINDMREALIEKGSPPNIKFKDFPAEIRKKHVDITLITRSLWVEEEEVTIPLKIIGGLPPYRVFFTEEYNIFSAERNHSKKWSEEDYEGEIMLNDSVKIKPKKTQNTSRYRRLYIKDSADACVVAPCRFNIRWEQRG